MNQFKKFIGIGLSVTMFASAFVAINQLDKEDFEQVKKIAQSQDVSSHILKGANTVGDNISSGAAIASHNIADGANVVAEKVNTTTYSAGMVAKSFGSYLQKISSPEEQKVQKEIFDDVMKLSEHSNNGEMNVEELNRKSKERYDSLQKPLQNKNSSHNEASRKATNSATHNTISNTTNEVNYVQKNDQSLRNASYNEEDIQNVIQKEVKDSVVHSQRSNSSGSKVQVVANPLVQEDNSSNNNKTRYNSTNTIENIKSIRSSAYDSYNSNENGVVTTPK